MDSVLENILSKSTVYPFAQYWWIPYVLFTSYIICSTVGSFFKKKSKI